MKQQYKSYQQTISFLEECVKKYPNLIYIQSIGKTWENRDIMLATITINVQNSHLKPALLYTGSIHAREWVGNELAVYFIGYLLDNYSSNPDILNTLTKNTIYIIPCLNPDGFEYSRNHFTFWRKNRRDNKDGTFGVDLNRNFSINFKKSKNKSSNIYSGPFAFSEPETRAIKNFVDNHDNITIALDYHSQGNVFFPAHNFNHEAERNGTSLNILCANMNFEISKITGRKYGIHRGKPPAKLINGSGREYYYSKGILAIVIEVGSRNIPDYMQNMQASVDENIPALLLALSEAQNYSKNAPLMVNDFYIHEYTQNMISLKWDYNNNKDIYFEIYRHTQNKEACVSSNLIAKTYKNTYDDYQLKSNTIYYYYIRSVNKLQGLKSPFSPKLTIKTLLDDDEFSKTIFPLINDVGYVSEKKQALNIKHFGVNSLFIGINETIGNSFGVIKFNLNKIPKNAIIKNVKFSLYALNRVNAKIENYGEWQVSLIDALSINKIYDYDEIKNAKNIITLGETISSEMLTQGKWNQWNFNESERNTLKQLLQDNNLLFKIHGPSKLPIGRDSQMMVFDLGYGSFGGGINYRPNIDITYTVPSKKIEIKTSKVKSYYKNTVISDSLECGFDENNNKVYALMEFDLISLPNPDETIITHSYIQIKNTNYEKVNIDIRYNLEFVDLEKTSYESIINRQKIEFIGYEIDKYDLEKEKLHRFIFDKYSCIKLEHIHKKQKNAKFIIKPSSAIVKNHIIKWFNDGDDETCAKLIINYIVKKRNKIPPIKNIKYKIENNKIKLTWTNPNVDDFTGVYVVRNRFHIPKNPLDGDKIYAGNDNYTFDEFGNYKIAKYYCIFAYNNVPIYSEGISIYCDVNN